MASFSQGMYLIEDSPAIACYKTYWAEEERNLSILLALPCNSNFHQLLQAFLWIKVSGKSGQLIVS